MQYFVPLIPQMTSMGCWAASIAMVQSWAGQTSVDPGTIAARDGYQAKLATGLAPSDDKILRDWGFATEAPQSYTVAGFMQLLQQYGPLWVACLVGGGAHVRVVTGFDPDPDPSLATVYVNDPWHWNDNLHPSEHGLQVYPDCTSRSPTSKMLWRRAR